MFNNIYKNKRVFITGHTGFKGSWLALWLTKLGAKVCGYSLVPNTDFIMNNTFWVGTFPALGEEEISRIASNIHSLINEKIGVQI